MQQIKTKQFLLVLVLTLILLFYVSFTQNQEIETLSSVNYKSVEEPKRKPTKSASLKLKPKNVTKKLKRILYWNDYYGSRNFGFCCGRNPYLKYYCENTNCYTSKDRTGDLSSFDAIVFHGRSLNINDIPKKRYPHQLYVFLTIESAAYPGIGNFSVWEDFFNITMTYRLDSDVPLLYGSIERNKHIKKILPVKTKQKKQFIKQKKHLIAWLVSNCHTQSKRELLIEDLRQYLPADSIHIYGKCGNKRCSRDSPDARDDCWSMLEKDYKFYLALENSICPDYVTEKMFEALKHDIVPVVLGGADYKSIFPPQSFISMMDFRNMSSLAQLLIKLDQDDNLYSQYLTWKTQYTVNNSKEDFNQAHCRLCQLLHEYEDESKRKVVKNLKDWFLDKKPCWSHSSLL